MGTPVAVRQAFVLVLARRQAVLARTLVDGALRASRF